MSRSVSLKKDAPVVKIRNQRRVSAARIVVFAFFGVLLVTQLYPLVWLLIYSLKTNEEILSGSSSPCRLYGSGETIPTPSEAGTTGSTYITAAS